MSPLCSLFTLNSLHSGELEDVLPREPGRWQTNDPQPQSEWLMSHEHETHQQPYGKHREEEEAGGGGGGVVVSSSVMMIF